MAVYCIYFNAEQHFRSMDKVQKKCGILILTAVPECADIAQNRPKNRNALAKNTIIWYNRKQAYADEKEESIC